jgi:hypothetical protein
MWKSASQKKGITPIKVVQYYVIEKMSGVTQTQISIRAENNWTVILTVIFSALDSTICKKIC